MNAAAPEFTRDHLLRGRLVIFQPRRGYRTSLDPLLLGFFVTPPVGRFLDVGAGSGAVSFVLLHRYPDARGLAIELQPRLASLLHEGAQANGFSSRLDLVLADARRVPLSRPSVGSGFDVMVTNPPFQVVGRGPAPADVERRRAHHEETLNLSEWVCLAADQLREHGRLAVIFPADRRHELVQALSHRGFTPSRRRLVRATADSPATRVLLEATRARYSTGPVEDLPDLVVHHDGGFSPEMRTMLGEPAAT